MKKTYSAPTIEVESFDVIDIITTSATITRGNESTGNAQVYEVEIAAKW